MPLLRRLTWLNEDSFQASSHPNGTSFRTETSSSRESFSRCCPGVVQVLTRCCPSVVKVFSRGCPSVFKVLSRRLTGIFKSWSSQASSRRHPGVFWRPPSVLMASFSRSSDVIQASIRRHPGVFQCHPGVRRSPDGRVFFEPVSFWPSLFGQFWSTEFWPKHEIFQ